MRKRARLSLEGPMPVRNVLGKLSANGRPLPVEAPDDLGNWRKVRKREALQHNARRSRFPLARVAFASAPKSYFMGEILRKQRIIS